jgi:hypothetical protein
MCVFKVEKTIAALASSTFLEILKERLVTRVAITCEIVESDYESSLLMTNVFAQGKKFLITHL